MVTVTSGTIYRGVLIGGRDNILKKWWSTTFAWYTWLYQVYANKEHRDILNIGIETNCELKNLMGMYSS